MAITLGRREFNDLISYMTKIEHDVRRYPILTKEQELQLYRDHKSNGTLDGYREILVKSNLRFAISIAKKYIGRGMDYADLIGEANFGLVKAAQRFDPERGYRFISYAVWWIRQSILDALTNQSRMIRLPNNKLREQAKLKNFLRQNGENYSNGHLVVELRISKELVDYTRSDAERPYSLDFAIDPDDEEMTLERVLSQDNQGIMSEENITRNIGLLNRFMNSLSPREQKIINLYFGFNGYEEMGLEEIGKLPHINLSRERVRQIKENALAKIRGLAKQENLTFDDFFD